MYNSKKYKPGEIAPFWMFQNVDKIVSRETFGYRIN